MNMKTMSKIASTLGTASVGYSIAVNNFGNDIVTQLVGVGTFGVIGYSVVFIAIPTLLKNKMLTLAFMLGLMMSFTWVLNSNAILDIYKTGLMNKIDPKFPQYKKAYIESKDSIIYVSKDLPIYRGKEVELKQEIKLLKEKTDTTGEYFMNLRDSVKNELHLSKSKSGKNWKNVYPRIAKENGCSNKISFARLVNCVSKNRFQSEANGLLISLNDKKDELLKVSSLVVAEEGKENASKRNGASANTLNAKNKAEYLRIRAEAKSQTDKVVIIVYLAVWIWGLFIEVIVMMFGELIDFLVKKKETTDIVEAEKKIECKIAETVLTVNTKGQEFMLLFAQNHPTLINFKAIFLYRGKMRALTNNIAGCFLYAYTIKKEGAYITSWSQLSSANVLYVNGKTEETTISQFKGTELGLIPVLGSTARKNNSKDVLAWLKARGSSDKFIVPQRVAIDYLVGLEKQDRVRYSPHLITEEDIRKVIYSFTAEFSDI